MRFEECEVCEECEEWKVHEECDEVYLAGKDLAVSFLSLSFRLRRNGSSIFGFVDDDLLLRGVRCWRWDIVGRSDSRGRLRCAVVSLFLRHILYVSVVEWFDLRFLCAVVSSVVNMRWHLAGGKKHSW